MDRFEAYTVLKRIVEESDDDEASDALRSLVGAATPFPPTPLGRATNEAHWLAEQLTKTGRYSQWHTPPNHSEAMERLIWRVTTFLEALLNLFEDGNNSQNNEVNQ